MLLVAGILGVILTLAVFLLVFVCNLMSPTGKQVTSWWPAVALALFTVACFVARHFLAGRAMTW